MYYTDITNKELQAFHPVQAHNFTVSLTQILSSPLFKVETIGDLYRIVPLFYTGRITSTNPSDKILDDKLIIANQGTDETYYTFISDEEAEIKDYTEYGDYYEIGDSLTTAQFNAIVSMLRQNTVNTENIRINDIIHGVYGDYELDIEDVSIIDKGIVISQDTITAEPKIRLSNNYFKYSTYTLKLTVLKYTGVNIFDTETQDYTEETSIEIELTPGTWVDIPVTDLESGSIILFDGVVEITHDQPVVILPTTLEVTSDKDVIQTGDNATITATLLDQKNIPIPDETLTFTFLHGETTVETQTAVTDKDGVCSVSYTGKGTGELNIQVSRGLLSETYSIMDCGWYDTGVTGTTSLYFLQTSDVTRSIGDDGTTISNSNTTSSRYACVVITSVSSLADVKQFTGNNMIEVDIISYTGGTLQINGDSNASVSLATYGTAPFTMQIKVVDGVAYYYTGSEWTTLATVGGNAYAIRFAILAGTTIKYKNWKIYPI